MDSCVTFTVSDLNDYVKALVDSSEVLCNVCVVGEISNFNKHYKTGHMYFTLKDEKSLLKCVMFRSDAVYLKFEPQNSQRVLVYGRISVFARDGVYQLYASHIDPFGKGALYAEYERLKAKLSEEGLFDEGFKKQIVRYPRRIGIITSPEAAAVADMKNIITRRYPLCEIHIYPALVQGKGAPRELCQGIVHFDKDEMCDTIIIGRGGGSIEDLWAFNDEILARTIFACKTPVISAVGHETDFTICDFVSDLRAPTPSAAAELAVPDILQLKAYVSGLSQGIDVSIKQIINNKKMLLSRLAEKPSLKNPMFFVDSRNELLLKLGLTMDKSINRLMDIKKRDMSLVSARLSALNPMEVLSRGYSAVFDNQNNVVSSVKQIKKGDGLTLCMSDGKAFVTVDSKTVKKHNNAKEN